MDTKFSIPLHILAYIAETNKTVTSELLAKSVETNASHIRKILALLNIFKTIIKKRFKIYIIHK